MLMNIKLLLHFLKILLRDRKKIIPMILILITASASIYASEYSIYNLRNVIFLESLNLIPDVRIRSSNENFTLSIVNMISSIITDEYLEYRPNVKIDIAFRLKEGFAIVSPREAFNYIVGINMSSDWVVEFLKNNIIACLSNFTFDNHYNNFTIIIPKYLADFLNLTIGDKIISYEGYTFTVAAIYNVTTLFSDILANVLFELPIFTSINTFNIMLNYTTSKIIERIIAIRYRDPLIKDVNQYEEEFMSFLTFLQDRLAEKKIILGIEKDGATVYPYVPDAKLILISSMPKIKLINSVNEDIIKNVRLIIDAISYFSITIAFCITFVAFLSSLNERRREIAIIRALGLSPFSISLALVLTTTFILTISFIIGVMLSPIISQVITKILKEITGNKLLATSSEMPWNLEMLLSSYAILLISSQIATLTPFIFTMRESIATGLYQFKASKIKRISISRWYHVISLLVFILCITLSAYAILFEPLNIDILQIDVILWFTWPILFGITLFSKIPSYINKVVTKFSRSAYISTKHLKAYYARTLILFILLVFVFHYTLIPMAFSNFWVIGYRKELHELNEGKIPIVVSETTTVSSLDLDEFAEIPGDEYVVGFREFYVKNCKCKDTIITS
ncbi:MAG: ABC transporter permease, partial [Candidatus Asgardarchaeia archaeon]